MADLFDYIQWRGDLTFKQDPLNRVDALIFSALSYLSFGGSVEDRPDIPISLRDASEEFFPGSSPDFVQLGTGRSFIPKRYCIGIVFWDK